VIDKLVSRLDELVDQPWARPVIIALAPVLAAHLVEKVVTRVIATAASRTKTDLDDRIIEVLRRPVFLSVLLTGLSMVARSLHMGSTATETTLSALQTIAVFVWAGAGFRMSHEVLTAFSNRTNDKGLLQHRTIPIFEIVVKAAVIGGAIYFFFLAWDIDVTAWLASAGIVGIAVGFAAKDTLANLFSGLFIIADAPYRVGDYILLDGDIDGRPLRGAVTRIGMRSSRLITRDDLEITIPNALIGNSKIINETGGPTVKQRSRVSVGVAYGSDADLVEKVLLSAAEGVDGVCEKPNPEVRFRGFGDSSLDFELLFWIDRPRIRGLIQSRLNFKVYKALADAKLEIPFPQRDLWVKQLPTAN